MLGFRISLIVTEHTGPLWTGILTLSGSWFILFNFKVLVSFEFKIFKDVTLRSNRIHG